MRDEFGKTLKKHLIDNDLSVERLARRCNMKAAKINNTINNKSMFTSDEFETIAKALKLSSNDTLVLNNLLTQRAKTRKRLPNTNKSNQNVTFGKMLKKLLIDKDTSMSELAEVLKVTPTFVSNVCSGNRCFSEDLFIEAVEWLDLTPKQTVELSREYYRLQLSKKRLSKRRRVFKRAENNDTIDLQQPTNDTLTQQSGYIPLN